MSDADAANEKAKRFRSPPYPAFDLAKALERAALVLKVAHHHAVNVQVILPAWGMDSDVGPVWRYLATLIQYGLLTDSGTGKARKFQVTDMARRIIQDTEPSSQKRREALKAAALAPMIHNELWNKFGSAENLSDSVLKVYLTIDRKEAGESPYSETSASEVVQTYKATLTFAGLAGSEIAGDKISNKDPVSVGAHSFLEPKRIAVGDYVQWTSSGVDRFDSPRQVAWVSDDGSHVRVHGETTGLPIVELSLVAPPKFKGVEAKGNVAGDDAAPKSSVSVLMRGKRLEITADVDEAGLATLQEMLTKYAEILKLIK